MEDSSFDQIASERLVIRRFGPGDVEPLVEYRSDPEVARLQAWTSPYSTREAQQFVSGLRSLAPGKPGTWFQFAVALAPSGGLIGDVALRATRSDPSQAELGFTFSRSNQGQGYATEAVERVVDYAFGKLEMHRLFSITDVRNLAAQRLLERLQFRREGEFPGELLYAQLSSDWQPGQAI